MPDVAIVGTGQTDHKSRREDVNIPELVREAVDRALEDGGVTFAEIDAVCFGNMDLFEGLAENEHWLASAFGAAGKPLLKFNTGGTVGTSTTMGAYYLLKSGFYGRILAVGFEKQSEGNSQGAITTVGDPIWERPMMAGAIGNHAVDGLDVRGGQRRHRGAGGEGGREGAPERLPQPARAPEAAGHHRRAGPREQDARLPVAHARHVPDLERRLRDGHGGRRARAEARGAPGLDRRRRERPRPVVPGRQPEADVGDARR